MSHITTGHVRAFQFVRSPAYENITLADCFINGEAGVCIVMIDQPDSDHIAVMPLFVAITDGMKLDFPGQHSGDNGEGGGPKNPRDDYKASKASVTTPTPAA